MEKYTNKEITFVLRDLQERFKKMEGKMDVKMDIYDDHVIRCSRDNTYMKGIVEKLCRDNDEKDKRDLDESKDKVKKLTQLLFSIIVAICLIAVGINNIPSAAQKLIGII